MDNDKAKHFTKVYSMFTNCGYVPVYDEDLGTVDGFSDEPFEVNDLLTQPDLMRFIPTVVQTVVREALEPALLIVPNCFQTVNIPQGRMVQIGALGAMVASEIPEGGIYSVPSLTAMSANKIALNCGNNSIMEPTTYGSDTNSTVIMEPLSQSAANVVTHCAVQRLHGRPRCESGDDIVQTRPHRAQIPGDGG